MAFRKRRRRNQNVNNTSGSNSGQMMNLSLFIMLLAFFIVLNSLSTYEELKSEKVRRSLNITFNNDAQESLSSTRESISQSLSEGHTFDRIEGLFQSQITSFKSEKSKSSGQMKVDVDYDRFIKAMTQKDQIDIFKYPTRRETRDNFFLPTLVSLMKANINNAPTRLEIIFHTDKDPSYLQNQTPQIMREKINNIGEISRILEAQAMPEKLILIGLEKGDPEIVSLNFTKYYPFSPVFSNDDGVR